MVLGCPAEYPTHRLRTVLDQYVDITRVKQGTYKKYPQIRNGFAHMQYKKTYKPVPRFTSLPEGIRIVIKSNYESNSSSTYFRCGGNHLVKYCPQNEIAVIQSDLHFLDEEEPDQVQTTNQNNNNQGNLQPQGDQSLQNNPPPINNLTVENSTGNNPITQSCNEASYKPQISEHSNPPAKFHYRTKHGSLLYNKIKVRFQRIQPNNHL